MSMIGKTLLKKLSDFVFSRTHFRENLLDGLFGSAPCDASTLTRLAASIASASASASTGFFKEVESTEFERSDCGGYIAVAGDEDDGKRQILSLHALLELQTGHAGHADI